MSSRPAAVLCLWFCLAVASALPLLAIVEPQGPSAVAEKAYRHPDLDVDAVYRAPDELSAADATEAYRRLSALGVTADAARLDVRGGRWATLLPATPLLPGDGVGNALVWDSPPRDRAAHERAAWEAFAGYLAAHGKELGVELGELPAQGRVTVHGAGAVVQIHAPRAIDGVPVRSSYLSAVINHGNLVLFGAHRWGDVAVSTEPRLSAAEAAARLRAYLDPHAIDGFRGKSELQIVPLASGREVDRASLGGGYRHRLVWVIGPQFRGELGTWEALIDAHSGELLSFEDTNRYAEVKGGVYPVTNDGVVPDGVEQAGWPMPYQDTTLGTTDTGGNVAGSGSFTATFFGPYVNMVDQCGTDSLTGTNVIDWGTSGGDDCVTPGFGGAGNTHASRTGFYELNKMIEMARGQLPGNSWLQQRLTSNMNINNTCNAFWNGTVNFYRSGGGCSNTGEIAGVFDHEWGHGMDQNDATPGIASPSGEGIADIYTALRLDTSCIGRNFRLGTNCSGNGDPCLECDGVRDIDYLKRQSGQPHDYSWSNANCGSSVHCIGGVYSEAVWSLWKRKLQQPPYSYDNNTAHEIVTRLTFIGAGATGTWFSGGPPNGGCAAGSGYLNYLAADDDNGNLNDGTPHMTAIWESFNDQEIACPTPTVQDAGCAGTPTTAPSVTGTPSDKSVGLSWNAVAGASSYEVFRTEGVFQCDFGKVRLGATTGTTWNDTGLQNGRDYSYVVIPKGSADSCFGPASSCTTVTPAAGPNLAIDAASAQLSISGGDGDPYLDNCEDGTLTFDVSNTGLGALTNVRIVGAVPSNAGVTVTTSFPSPISPSILAEGATGSGSFSFTAGGLTPGETLTFQVEVTANELASSRFADLVIASTETDLQSVASQTYTFESGDEGWTTVQGTFGRSSLGGGAQGTTWYEQSSANLDNQCDQMQSPVMVLSATSTLELWNNFDIEPQYINSVWYDRANVGVVDVATGARTPVNPDGGRLYNASGAQGTCGTGGQQGWADAATTWGSSSWSVTALGSAGFAGQEVRLDVRYGTDGSLNGYGFRFDQVTVTDVSFQVADGQSDSCSAGCTSDPECDDGAYCNGAETCDIPSGTCQPGTPPVCDDGVACTDDTCNETTDSCDFDPNDANCDNGDFCDGAETCDPLLGCQAGTPPDCDDGVGCTDDACNEVTDSCDNVANDANCTDPDFCNGAEFCDPALDCQPGVDPCPGQFCDETGDFCYDCNVDADCDDGEFCNGAETCAGGFCQAGTDPCPGQGCDEAGDVCVAGPSARLEADCLTVGGTATTVTLAQSYTSPVVTTSVQYLANTTPVVTRVSNVTATSFDVRLQNPSGGAVAAENVCYLVVEEGTWTIDGVAVEAQRYTSTVTDDAPSNWFGEAQAYGQSYASPVVLGQVMSENDPGFSVFWDMATRANPPTATQLTTGKTVCEDTDTTRADEEVGFVVIETGHGTIGGVEYEAATGADTVAGVTNAPPYAYAFAAPFATAPTVAVVQMAAVDGNNGGWAQVHGATLATTTSLFLSIDEDQIGDTERSHTTEQVAYVAFAGPVVYPDVGCTSDAQCQDGDVCNGIETCDIPSGLCQPGTPLTCDDGVFCNGAETCDPGLGCQPGVPPSCDDGVGCTVDSCNLGTDSCDNLPDDASCDDGAFCTGVETCDPVLDCQSSGDPCLPGEICNESTDVCDPTPSTVMEWGTVSAGSAPVTVDLTGTYTNPVVVTSINYANNTIPVVTRISNVTATSFAVNLQNAGAGSVAADEVSYLVVEAGVHTVNGVLIEAQRYLSTVTDENNSWVGQAQTLAGSFTNPVVVGQVMSTNDADWSVFWDQGTARNSPPSATALRTGKTVCEDTLTARADETVGFVVVEAGHGTLGGVEFEAALGADTVRGVTQAPPYVYTFTTPFATAPSVAVVTMAGVDGGNGGWAYTFGPSPTSTTSLDLVIDEDTIGDTERNHTTEQVGYVVFASSGSASP